MRALFSSPHRFRYPLEQAIESGVLRQSFAIAALLLPTTLMPMATAQAATIVVAAGEVEISGNATCSLFEAFENANGDSQVHADCIGGTGVDTIQLTDSTYTLTATTGALPQINGTLTIEGNGAVIERSTAVVCNVFDDPVAGEFRILDFQGTQLDLEDLTVRNGCADGGGSLNDGGGLRIIGGIVNISSTTFEGNRAQDKSGAVDTVIATVTITDSTFTGNYAGGGAGAIGHGSSTMLIERSVIYGNEADGDGGGGIGNFGTLTVRNSTISGNTTSAAGGGIGSTGTVVLEFSTVFNNDAAGGVGGGVAAAGSIEFKNSIVAGNNPTSRGAGGDCYFMGASVLESGVNFDSDGTCEAANEDTFQIVSLEDLDLGALGDNGGSSWTNALGQNSVAQDVATDCNFVDASANTVDQRGVSRPQFFVCDAGAFERDRAPSTSLVGYWPFDEGAGSITEDLSNFSVDGQLSAGTNWVDEDAESRGVSRGIVLELDGESGDGDGADEVLIDDFVTDLGVGDFTISVWFKSAVAAGGGLLLKSADDFGWDSGDKQLWFGHGGVSCDNSGAYPAFVGHGNDYLIADSTVLDGEWHHLAVTWEVAPSGNSGPARSSWTAWNRHFSLPGTARTMQILPTR